MDSFGMVLTIVVLVGVAVFILLFEKKRAKQIERDLRGTADEQRRRRKPPDA